MHIITGQQISPEKLQRAKQLRKNMTPEERKLWEKLRAKRLNGIKFRRQQIIAGFIVDFYCHAAKLIIEIDGEIHQKQTEQDTEREKILLAYGLRILRIKNEQINRNLEEVLKLILEHCLNQPTEAP